MSFMELTYFEWSLELNHLLINFFYELPQFRGVYIVRGRAGVSAKAVKQSAV